MLGHGRLRFPARAPIGQHRRPPAGSTVRQRFLKDAKDARKSVDGFAGYLRNLEKDRTRRAKKRSRANVSASKVMDACDALLRNYHFETLLDDVGPTLFPPTDFPQALNE